MPSEEPNESTLDYVRRTAAKCSDEELIALVDAETRRLQEVSRRFPTERLSTPADGGWSARDVVAHVVARTMLRAREILFVAHTGEVPPPEEVALPSDVEGLLLAHSEAMESLFAHVREAPPDFRGIEWSHPAVGSMTWPQWMVFIHVHLDDHCEQLEQMASKA